VTCTHALGPETNAGPISFRSPGGMGCRLKTLRCSRFVRVNSRCWYLIFFTLTGRARTLRNLTRTQRCLLARRPVELSIVARGLSVL